MWNRIIFFLILLLPFQFATNIFVGADVSLFRLLILGVFMGLLFTILWERKGLVLPNGGVLWIISVLLVILGAILTAHQPEWALRKGFFLVNFLLWYVSLALLVVNKRIESKRVIEGIIFSGTAIALVGIFQWLGQFIFGLEPMLFVWREYMAPFFLGAVSSETVLEYSSWLVAVGGRTVFRAIAVFPDPHMFAFFLELCFPWAFFYFVETKKKKYLVFFGIMLLAIALSFSRGAYVGVLVGTIALGVLYYSRRENNYYHQGRKDTEKGCHPERIIEPRKLSIRRMRFLEGLIVVTFFVLSAGFLLGTDNFVRDRLKDTFFSLDASGEERLVLWDCAMRVIEEHPLLGVGLGGFPETVQPSAVYRDPIYVHNLYLDIAVEMGLVGLFVWLAGFVWMMRRFFVLGKGHPVFFAGVVSLVVYCGHGIFDTPLYSVQVLGILCVVGALGWSNFSSEEKSRE